MFRSNSDTNLSKKVNSKIEPKKLSINVNNPSFKMFLSENDNSGYSPELPTPTTPKIPIENKKEVETTRPANPNYSSLRDYDEDDWDWLLIKEIKEFEISRLLIKNDKNEITNRQILVKKNGKNIGLIDKGIESYGHFVCAINDNCIIYISTNKKDYKKDGGDYLQMSPWEISFYDLVNKKELFSIEVNFEVEKKFINKQQDQHFLYFHNDKINLFNMNTKQIEKQWEFAAKKQYFSLDEDEDKDIRTILDEFVGFFQNRLLVKTDNGYLLLPGNAADKTIRFGDKFTEVKIYENKLVTIDKSKNFVIDQSGEGKSCNVETLINSYALNSLTQTFNLIQQWALPIWLQKNLFTDNQFMLYTDKDSLFGLDLNSQNSEPKLLYKKSQHNLTIYAHFNFFLKMEGNQIIVKSLNRGLHEKIVLKCTAEELGILINNEYPESVSQSNSNIKTVHPKGIVKEKEVENKLDPQEMLSPKFLR